MKKRSESPLRDSVFVYLFSSILLCLACGTKTAIRGSQLHSDDADGAKKFASSVPPKEYYDFLLRQKMLALEENTYFLLTGNDSQVQTVWLNFEGATVRKGFSKGMSFLICTSETIIPTSAISFEDQQAVLAIVQGYFDNAGLPIKVVLEEPTGVPYTTVFIGESIEDLACQSKVNPVVLAPQDKGNINSSDVAFVFTEALKLFCSDSDKLPAYLAHAIGYAIGLTLGLSPDSQVRTVMYPVPSDEVEGFSTEAINEIKNSLKNQLLVASQAATQIQGLKNLPPEFATLPGLKLIAALAGEIPQLKKEEVVDISQIIPIIMQLLPDNVQTPELDKIITIIELALTVAANQGQNGGIDVNNLTEEDLIKIATAVLTTENLTKVGGIVALAVAGGGVGTVGAVIAGIQLAIDIVGDVQQANQATPTNDPVTNLIARVPNIAALLGISKIEDLKTLFEMIDAHAAVINGNFSGKIRDALLSAIKVAYAQKFLELTNQK